MNRTGKLIFLTGFILNLTLSLYVKGVSIALLLNSDWLHLLYELPEILATLIVAVILPYVMAIMRGRKNRITAATTMLFTTLLSGAVILLVHTELTAVLSLYIGWVILWFTAFYFLMVGNIEQSNHP